MEKQETNSIQNSEDNLSVTSVPLDMVFLPEAVEVPFQQKVKLQIAFYRTNKVCKTAPAKYLKEDANANKNISSNYVKLNPQTLPFCTTIVCDLKQKIFQSKKFNIQLALEADGTKMTLNSEMDLRTILNFQENFQKNNIQIKFKEGYKLFFGIKVKIMKLNDTVKSFRSKQSDLSKSHKDNQQNKKDYIEEDQKNQNKMTRSDDFSKIIKKNITFESKSIKMQDITNKNNHKTTKPSSLKNNTKIEQDEDFDKQFGKQIKKININSKQKENSSIGESSVKSVTLTSQNQSQLPQDHKKQACKIKQLTNEVQQQNKKIKVLETKCKHKLLKIQQLETNSKKLQQKLHQYTQKQKYYDNIEQKQNKRLETIQKLQKQLTQNLKKAQQYRYRMQQYSRRLNQKSSQVQLQRDTQITSLKKTIQAKDVIIKKHVQERQVKLIKIQNLNKQIKQMKQQMQSRKKNEQASLQIRVLNQKLRRQSDQAKKNEKNSITQKLLVQTKNKQLQSQIIKLKEIIGKVLNLVQQQGTGDLFIRVADCVS